MAGRPRPKSARAARRRSRPRDRRPSRNASSPRPARTPDAPSARLDQTVGEVGSRVPSRPIPESSLTWTRPAAGRRDPVDRSSVQATTSPPRRPPTRPPPWSAHPSRGSARRSRPVAARAPRERWPMASQLAPPATPRGPSGPLRDRSASALTTAHSAGTYARQPCAVALDRCEVDDGSGAHDSRPRPDCAAALRSRPTRSRLRPRAAPRPADRPAHGASRPRRPPRTARRPWRGSRRAPLPARRPCPASPTPGVPPGLTATSPSGAATSVSSPLSTTIGPLARRRPPDVLEARRRDLVDSTSSSRASSPACGVRTVGARRDRRAPSRPAWAFRPSASRTSGSSACAVSARAKSAPAGPRPGPSTSAPPRRASSSTVSTPSASSEPSRVGQRPRHRLEQADLEHERQRRRDAGGDVSGAGAHRRLGDQARRPGQPGGAAGNEDVAARELRRVGRAPGDQVEHDRMDQADVRVRRGARRDPDVDTRTSPRELCPERSTDRAWRRWKSRSSRRTASPETAPVDASTPLGTSAARRPRRSR